MTELDSEKTGNNCRYEIDCVKNGYFDPTFLSESDFLQKLYKT